MESIQAIFQKMTDPVLRRLYKFVIKKMVGKFLDSELLLDQLKVQLREGKIELENLHLKVSTLNEHLVKAPFEIESAFLGKFCVRIGYLKLDDSCSVNIEDLTVNLTPKSQLHSKFPEQVHDYEFSQCSTSFANTNDAQVTGDPERLDFVASWIAQITSKIKITVKNLKVFCKPSPNSGIASILLMLPSIRYRDATQDHYSPQGSASATGLGHSLRLGELATAPEELVTYKEITLDRHQPVELFLIAEGGNCDQTNLVLRVDPGAHIQYQQSCQQAPFTDRADVFVSQVHGSICAETLASFQALAACYTPSATNPPPQNQEDTFCSQSAATAESLSAARLFFAKNLWLFDLGDKQTSENRSESNADESEDQLNLDRLELLLHQYAVSRQQLLLRASSYSWNGNESSLTDSTSSVYFDAQQNLACSSDEIPGAGERRPGALHSPEFFLKLCCVGVVLNLECGPVCQENLPRAPTNFYALAFSGLTCDKSPSRFDISIESVELSKGTSSFRVLCFSGQQPAFKMSIRQTQHSTEFDCDLGSIELYLAKSTVQDLTSLFSPQNSQGRNLAEMNSKNPRSQNMTFKETATQNVTYDVFAKAPNVKLSVALGSQLLEEPWTKLLHPKTDTKMFDDAVSEIENPAALVFEFQAFQANYSANKVASLDFEKVVACIQYPFDEPGKSDPFLQGQADKGKLIHVEYGQASVLPPSESSRDSLNFNAENTKLQNNEENVVQISFPHIDLKLSDVSYGALVEVFSFLEDDDFCPIHDTDVENSIQKNTKQPEKSITFDISATLMRLHLQETFAIDNPSGPEDSKKFSYDFDFKNLNLYHSEKYLNIKSQDFTLFEINEENSSPIPTLHKTKWAPNPMIHCFGIKLITEDSQDSCKILKFHFDLVGMTLRYRVETQWLTRVLGFFFKSPPGHETSSSSIKMESDTELNTSENPEKKTVTKVFVSLHDSVIDFCPVGSVSRIVCLAEFFHVATNFVTGSLVQAYTISLRGFDLHLSNDGYDYSLENAVLSNRGIQTEDFWAESCKDYLDDNNFVGVAQLDSLKLVMRTQKGESPSKKTTFDLWLGELCINACADSLQVLNATLARWYLRVAAFNQPTAVPTAPSPSPNSSFVSNVIDLKPKKENILKDIDNDMFKGSLKAKANLKNSTYSSYKAGYSLDDTFVRETHFLPKDDDYLTKLEEPPKGGTAISLHEQFEPEARWFPQDDSPFIAGNDDYENTEFCVDDASDIYSAVEGSCVIQHEIETPDPKFDNPVALSPSMNEETGQSLIQSFFEKTSINSDDEPSSCIVADTNANTPEVSTKHAQLSDSFNIEMKGFSSFSTPCDFARLRQHLGQYVDQSSTKEDLICVADEKGKNSQEESYTHNTKRNNDGGGLTLVNADYPEPTAALANEKKNAQSIDVPQQSNHKHEELETNSTDIKEEQSNKNHPVLDAAERGGNADETFSSTPDRNLASSPEVHWQSRLPDNAQEASRWFSFDELPPKMIDHFFFKIPSQESIEWDGRKDRRRKIKMKFILHSFSLKITMFGGTDWQHQKFTTNGQQKPTKFSPKKEGLLSGLIEDYQDTIFKDKKHELQHYVKKMESVPCKRLKYRNWDRKVELFIDGIKIRSVSYLQPPNEDDKRSSRVEIRCQKIEGFTFLAHRKKKRQFLSRLNDFDPKGKQSNWSDFISLELTNVRTLESLAISAIPDECQLRAALKPIKCWIDRKLISFLEEFFSYSCKCPPEQASQEILPDAQPEVFFQYCHIASCLLQIDNSCTEEGMDLKAFQKGDYTELLNLIPLHDVRLKLQGHRFYGLSGWPQLINLLLQAWVNDITSSQLHKFISGIAPVRPLVNVGKGVANLVMLPVTEYRKKDGRILRAIRRGAKGLVKTVTLEMLNVSHWLTKHTANVLNDISTPARLPGIGQNDATGKCCEYFDEQPSGVCAGLSDGWSALSHEMVMTAQTIIALPIEYQHTGATGLVTSVIRAVPIAVIRPIVGATEAVSCTLLGVRNTFDPQSRQREQRIWRNTSRGVSKEMS